MKETFHASAFMKRMLAIVALLSLHAGAPSAHAQSDTARADSLRPPLVRVFAECNDCERDYLRQQLGFVNLVRDRLIADVHVLVTSLQSGGGGTQYSIELAGKGRSDTVLVDVRADATGIEQREQLVRAIKIGLLPFLRGTPSFARLDVIDAVPGGTGTARGERDRWNGWLYRVYGSGSADGDDNYGAQQGNLELSASQTTDARKILLNAAGEYRKSRYELEEGRIIHAHQRSWSLQGIWVHSITGHLSAGLVASARSSLFGNTTLATRTALGVEYNLLPYREATRRSAIVLYTIGVRSARYVDTTIFGLLRETRPLHTLAVTTESRQRWGSIFLVAESSQYLHDRQRYRLAVDGGFDWRIARGLSIGMYASYAITRDQLNIPGTNLSDEDRLLRLRELRSGSSFQTNVSASYTFGSLFNNIVNPRMRKL